MSIFTNICMHAYIPNDPGEMGMQSHAQERGCLCKDEGLCGSVRRCVRACMFTSIGKLTRKHVSSGRQKSKLCAMRRCERPVAKGQQFLGRRGSPLCTGQSLHACIPVACGNGCSSLISLFFQFCRQQEPMFALAACSPPASSGYVLCRAAALPHC